MDLALAQLIVTPPRAAAVDFLAPTSTYEFIWKTAQPKEVNAIGTVLLPFDGATWAFMGASWVLVAALLILVKRKKRKTSAEEDEGSGTNFSNPLFFPIFVGKSFRRVLCVKSTVNSFLIFRIII